MPVEKSTNGFSNPDFHEMYTRFFHRSEHVRENLDRDFFDHDGEYFLVTSTEADFGGNHAEPEGHTSRDS